MANYYDFETTQNGNVVGISFTDAQIAAGTAGIWAAAMEAAGGSGVYDNQGPKPSPDYPVYPAAAVIVQNAFYASTTSAAAGAAIAASVSYTFAGVNAPTGTLVTYPNIGIPYGGVATPEDFINQLEASEPDVVITSYTNNATGQTVQTGAVVPSPTTTAAPPGAPATVATSPTAAPPGTPQQATVYVGPIEFDLPDGSTQAADLPTVAALLAAGGIPVDQNGNDYAVTNFDGGYLFNGLPLNVILFGQWYPGQQAAVVPAYLSSSSPYLNLPTGSAPTATLSNGTSVPGPTGIFGLTTDQLLEYVSLGLLAWKLLK